jgi:hypothetical protein
VERLEREEMDKRKMDLLEHEIKEEKRRQANENAFKVAQAQMDHVKTFHSGMMLSDVLHERQLQLATLKKKRNV